MSADVQEQAHGSVDIYGKGAGLGIVSVTSGFDVIVYNKNKDVIEGGTLCTKRVKVFEQSRCINVIIVVIPGAPPHDKRFFGLAHIYTVMMSHKVAVSVCGQPMGLALCLVAVQHRKFAVCPVIPHYLCLVCVIIVVFVTQNV